MGAARSGGKRAAGLTAVNLPVKRALKEIRLHGNPTPQCSVSMPAPVSNGRADQQRDRYFSPGRYPAKKDTSPPAWQAAVHEIARLKCFVALTAPTESRGGQSERVLTSASSLAVARQACGASSQCRYRGRPRAQTGRRPGRVLTDTVHQTSSTVAVWLRSAGTTPLAGCATPGLRQDLALPSHVPELE